MKKLYKRGGMTFHNAAHQNVETIARSVTLLAKAVQNMIAKSADVNFETVITTLINPTL